MLSTYELTNEEYPELLEQSVKLADKLAYGWVGVGFQFIHFNNLLIVNLEQQYSLWLAEFYQQ